MNPTEENVSNRTTIETNAPRAPRQRRIDNGPDLLPHLEHWVRLVRRVTRPGLLLQLLKQVGDVSPELDALVNASGHGALSIAARNAMFAAITRWPQTVQEILDRAAERISLLCDEFGTTAVDDELQAQDSNDAELLRTPCDRFSKALYLFLRQHDVVWSGAQDQRFDHAETRQELLKHARSEGHSSHYLGPSGLQPAFDAQIDDELKARLIRQFPHLGVEDIVVERFVRRDLSRPGQPVVLFTLCAEFNGTRVQYRQVNQGEVFDRDEPAATAVHYCWQPDTGALSVYCDDRAARPDLAALFRDVVLGSTGELRAMPLRAFDLLGFSSSAMLDRIRRDRIDGIDSVSIQQIVFAKPRLPAIPLRGKSLQRLFGSDFRLRRHRFEDRSVYEVAAQDLGTTDLSAFEILSVTLSIRMAKTAHRRAHNVTVSISTPNRFTERRLSDADRQLIFAQLLRLGCARQF